MNILITLILSMIFINASSNAFIKKNDQYTDKREELYNINEEAINKLAKATLVLMKKSDALKLLKQQSLPSFFEKGFNYYPDPLQSFYLKVKPCKSVRFSEQPSIGLCTGFLIAKDILITAGHCVQNSCNKNRVWVKNYKLNSQDRIHHINESDIFPCKKILDRKLKSPYPVYENTIDPRFDDTTPDRYGYDGVIDYAVIRIDQKKEIISNNFYVRPRLTGIVPKGDELFMIGSPLGLPTKVTLNGKVLEYRINQVIITDLDAFKGNSGSPVFNRTTGKVEGILTRTGPSFYKNSEDNCYQLKFKDLLESADNELSELTPINKIPNLKLYLGK